jgi:O-antigen ligase
VGWLLIALLAWGALAFGAVYPWAYWPLAAGCVTLGAWAVLKTQSWRDPRTTSLGMALGAVAAAIALQLVPLPSRAIAVVSPAQTSYFERFQFGYQPATFLPLSVSPGLTWTTLGLFVALAVLLVGLARALRRVSLSWLMNALMGLGVTLAVIGIVQKTMVIDPDHPLVYGFWKPREGGHVFGPFINRNHFAGWMVMGLPVVIGYSCGIVAALRRPQHRGWKDWLHWGSSVEANRFILAAGAILVMAASLMLTQSRSGLLGFAAGVAIIAVFVVARATQPAVRAAALLYFGVLVVGAVIWTGGNSAVVRWSDAPRDVSGRTNAWRDTLTIIHDFPAAGTGLGTYGKAMLVYQTGSREMMYAQAHNDYLQLAAEGGVLVGVPAVVVLVLLVRIIRRRLNASDDDLVTSWVRVGAIAGLAGIGLQSLMEFSLQMPGNAVMFVFVAALAMHRPRRSSRAHRI